MRVFIPIGYDVVGGVFATLAEAVAAATANPDEPCHQVDEFIVGQRARVASYHLDGKKWEENGNQYAEMKP